MHGIPFAIQGKTIVHVDEVERGLACNCVCPKCKNPLIARKGDVNAHHFAHYNVKECEGAFETALHLAAKDIIKEHRELMLPGLKVEHLGWVYSIDPQPVKFESIDLERSVNGFVPDVIAKHTKDRIWIEIAVTHFVEPEKAAFVEENNIPCFEINLSNVNRNIKYEQLQILILKSPSNRYWIYTPKSNTGKLAIESMIVKQRGYFEAFIHRMKEIDPPVVKGCPLPFYEKADIICGNFKHKILDLITSGMFWNGKIYETSSNWGWEFGDSSVYINGKKYSWDFDEKFHLKLWNRLVSLGNSRGRSMELKSCKKCTYHKRILKNPDDSVDYVECLWHK